jgi:hypothetical protein
VAWIPQTGAQSSSPCVRLLVGLDSVAYLFQRNDRVFRVLSTLVTGLVDVVNLAAL